MITTAQRQHSFSYGHRVFNHESKCAHLHGHNGKVHFVCTAADLDQVGRVIDFSVIKEKLCMWIELNWDHKTLIWEKDPWLPKLRMIDPSVVSVPFNPTAENIAQYLVEIVGRQQLPGLVQLVEVTFEETDKCSATYSRKNKFEK